MAAKIEVDIENFILAHPGGWISPVIPNNKLPPQQRGPNCGFYALAYVLNYWHNCGGDEANKPAPLPARTHQDELQQQKPVLRSFKQALKTFREREGSFTSLREFAKYNHLTVLGSIFDANNLVKVARGENSMYAGRFDGSVEQVTVDSFEKVVKALLDAQCPVIVPYDFIDKDCKDGLVGQPGNLNGDHAHWVPVIGYYISKGEAVAVYYNYGEYYWAWLKNFAVSNNQLTSNKKIDMEKWEGWVETSPGSDKWKLILRDYMTQQNAEDYDKSYKAETNDDHLKRKMIKVSGSKRTNPEFNDPTEGGKVANRSYVAPDGKERNVVGGLRNRVVVIYCAKDKDRFAQLLAKAR